MIVESSRDPERQVMVWPGIPAGLTREQALAWWERHKKPKVYKLERFHYTPATGRFETIGSTSCR